MANYTKTVNFAAKDLLSSGDTNKIIRGTEINTEYNNIATAVSTKADSNNSVLTGTTTIAALTFNGVVITATGTELNYVGGVTSNIQTQINSKAAIGANVSVFVNDSGYLTTVAFGDLTSTPTTLAGYGITDAATSAQGALADSATQPGDNISTLTNDSGYLTSYTETDTLDNVTGRGATTTNRVTVGGITLTNSYIEENRATSITGSTALDPDDGTIQRLALTGNVTFTDSLVNGESITLHIDDGTARTITWPTMEWIGGSAPTLDTTNETVVTVWKVNSTLYGVSLGVAS